MKAKNLSKVLAFLVAAVMIFSALPLMAFATDEATTYTVSFGAPAIPMNVDTKVDLKTLNVEMVKGDAAVSGADITWAADAQEGLILDAVNKTVEVTAVGNYKLTATVDGGTPKNIWVIAKPANEETIYLVNIPNIRDTITGGKWHLVNNKNDGTVYDVVTEASVNRKYLIPGRVSSGQPQAGMDFVQVQSNVDGTGSGGALVYIDEIFNDFADYTVETFCAVANVTNDNGAGVVGRAMLDATSNKYTKGTFSLVRRKGQAAIAKTAEGNDRFGGAGDAITPSVSLWCDANAFYTVKDVFNGSNVSFYINDDGVDKINGQGDHLLDNSTYVNQAKNMHNDGAGYPGVMSIGGAARFAKFYVYLNSNDMPAPMTDEPEAPAPEADITIVSGVGTGTATVEAVVGSENTYTVTLTPAEGYKLKVGSLVINGDIAHEYDDTGCVYTFTTDDLDTTTIAVEYIQDNGQFNTAMLGATIPTDPEVKGIRFGARTDSIVRSTQDATKGLLNDTINVGGVEYPITDIGMILFPTQPLGDAELTVATDGVVRQSVTKIVGLTNDYADIAITLTGIPDTMVGVQITSRMYVAYTDTNDATQYVYSNAISKSYNDVVEAIAQ